MDKWWKLSNCDSILSILYMQLAFPLSNLFELVLTTYIYSPIECPPRASFVGVFGLTKIDVCLLTHRTHSKSSFNMGVFEFARISCTSIGYLNATQKLHLWTKNNTLELLENSTHKGLLWMSCQKNISHVIQTMQFTYGHLVSTNSIELLYYSIFTTKFIYLKMYTLNFIKKNI